MYITAYISAYFGWDLESAVLASDLLADTYYANEYYLRHLLREDRLPDFQRGGKAPRCGELFRNDQRIHILHPSKEADMTFHQSDGNICGESNDPCCNCRVTIKTIKARRGKCDIVLRLRCLEVHKHPWIFAGHTCLLPCVFPFRHIYYIEPLHCYHFPEDRRTILLNAGWFGMAFRSLTAITPPEQ